MYTVMNGDKQKLLVAEQKAKELFTAVEDWGLITPGKSEMELCRDIVELAYDYFGIKKFWHKNIVRTGANTLRTYSANPPGLKIKKDDIVILDFGPIVDGYEADFARTYVIGKDPLKLKLKNDVETAWHEARAWHSQQCTLTGAECFAYVTGLAKKYGWEYGGEIAGHIVGRFPHEQAGPGDMGLDIHPDNHSDILLPDKQGNSRHWILEIHFVDRVNNIGGFFEQLVG